MNRFIADAIPGKLARMVAQLKNILGANHMTERLVEHRPVGEIL